MGDGVFVNGKNNNKFIRVERKNIHIHPGIVHTPEVAEKMHDIG